MVPTMHTGANCASPRGHGHTPLKAHQMIPSTRGGHRICACNAHGTVFLGVCDSTMRCTNTLPSPGCHHGAWKEDVRNSFVTCAQTCINKTTPAAVHAAFRGRPLSTCIQPIKNPVLTLKKPIQGLRNPSPCPFHVRGPTLAAESSCSPAQ